MIAFRCTLIAGLVFILASCSKEPNLKGNNEQKPDRTPAPLAGHFGSLGQTSSGRADAQFSIKTPYWRNGDQTIVCGLAEYPGRPLQPAFVLLVKLPATASLTSSSGVGTDGGKSYWHPSFTTAAGKTFPVRYEIKHDPAGEHLMLGEKAYALEDGRVFLMDLAAEPVQPIQVKAEVKDLVAGGDPGQESLQSAVEKLRKQHETIRKFWHEGR